MSIAASPSGPTAGALPPGVPSLLWLTRRELIRFGRQPSRIIAAIGTPLLFWIVFGAGFAGSFAQSGSGTYVGYLLPGMAALTVMFSSIFAAMSLIEDRRAGFLQSVLASPAPRWALVGAKIAGGSIIAAAQGAVLILLAPVLGVPLSLWGFMAGMAALLLISVFINGLGLAAAWRIDSSQGFHGVMNLVLMPMWILSSALFPWRGAAVWLQAIMLVNPLYWPTAALRASLFRYTEDGLPTAMSEPVSWPAMWLAAVLVAAGGFTLAWMTVGRIRPGRRRARS